MTYNPQTMAAENGFPGNLEATNHADQVNQLLGSHAFNLLYPGTKIVEANTTSTDTFGAFYWLDEVQTDLIGGVGFLPNYDVDQAFVMPVGETAVGYVQAAMLPVGDGADVQVSLREDDAGVPGAVLASTVVPKSWITNLAAVNGLAGGSQLMLAGNNLLQGGFTTVTSWNLPSVSGTGLLSTASGTNIGNYTIFVGGTNSSDASGTPLPNVFSLEVFAGATTPPLAQPSLPQGTTFPSVCATSDTLIVTGGITQTTPSVIIGPAVYTANFNNGVISAWSAQADFPYSATKAGSATWNDSFVYVVGGWDGTQAHDDVNYAALSNGTITEWISGPPIPNAVFGPLVAVIGDVIIVAGGTPDPTNDALSATYWAQINPDGSLGVWNTGPDMKVGVEITSSNSYFTTDEGVYVVGGVINESGSRVFASVMQSLTVSDHDLGAWRQQELAAGLTIEYPVGGVDNGDGTFSLSAFTFTDTSGTAVSVNFTVYSVPFIPVPLPASGLTPGSTYHVTFHQIGGDLTNYTVVAEYRSSSLQWQYSNRYSDGSWSAHTEHALMMDVYNQDVSEFAPFQHIWQDPTSDNVAGAASIALWDRLGRMLGYLDSALFPTDPLNVNPTFESGTSPWTATGGTLTQSSAETHGGYTESGLITPDGVTASVYAQSELIRVAPGEWYQAQGWLYSPTGYSNVSLSVNWYDANQAYLSSSSSTVTLTAATWTQQVNNFQAPAEAAYAALVPTQGGTPTTSNVFYLSYVSLTAFDPTVMSSVAQVTYGTSPWPPTGITQLN